MTPRIVAPLALALLLAPPLPLAGGKTPPPTPRPVRQLAIKNKPWTGDLDKLLERRMIRVLVPFSRTLYYTDKGRERGITADAVREFEMYLNQKYKTGKRPVTVYLLPTTRDKLLSGVAAGLGDIAAKMRREARQGGLDPDKWFNNVEIVVAEKIGAETTTYVRNVYKYYVAYKLTLEMQEAQPKARESLSQTGHSGTPRSAKLRSDLERKRKRNS